MKQRFQMLSKAREHCVKSNCFVISIMKMYATNFSHFRSFLSFLFHYQRDLQYPCTGTCSDYLIERLVETRIEGVVRGHLLGVGAARHGPPSVRLSS